MKSYRWALMKDVEVELKDSCRELKASECSNKGSEEEVNYLPLDIISEILSRLPIESILRCRSVCKSWYGLTKGPCFIELQLSRAMCQPQRFIMTGHMDKSPCHLFFLDREWNAGGIQMEELDRYGLRIEGSCNGLVCVALHSLLRDATIFICNPITREYIKLPKSSNYEICNSFSEIGFAFDPICKTYKVVRLHRIRNSEDTKCEIITLGQNSWRDIEIPYRKLYLFQGSRVVFLDGAFHWLIGDEDTFKPEQILVLDISTEKFRTIRIPPHIKKFTFELRLMKFGKSLAIFQFSYDFMYIWQIVGNHTIGYLLYEYFYDLSLMKDEIYWLTRTQLVGMLDNDSFLLDVSIGYAFSSYEEQFGAEEGDTLLFLYFPAKEEYCRIRVTGVRRWADIASFVPSLVSPCVAAAAVNGGSEKGT